MAPTEGSQAYASIVEEYAARGFEPNIITFMFDQLPGSPAEIAWRINQAVERVYRTYLPRMIRNPCAPSKHGKLPVWITAPDLPVYKRAKQSLRDVSVNDGLHVQGFALDTPYRRDREEPLVEHFHYRWSLYRDLCPELARIHIKPITDDICYVSDYLFKTVQRGRVAPDGVLVLPRTLQEVKGKDTRIGRTSSIIGSS